MNNLIFLLVLNTVAVITIVLVVFNMYQEKEQEAPLVPTHNGFCYWKTVQPGDSFTESSPGKYEYQTYATARGVEVWKRCE